MRHPHPRRRGISTLYTVLIMIVLAGFVSFATDYGHVQLAKSQLEVATDAAARFGAKYMALGQATVYSKAAAAAAENSVNGSSLALQSADVSIGRWNSATKTFTVNGAPTNAVQVKATLSSARGTAINL